MYLQTPECTPQEQQVMLVPQPFLNTILVAVQRKTVSAAVPFREELDVIVVLVLVNSFFILFFYIVQQ